MNKRAQMDIEPIPVLLGIVGGISAYIMAGRMEAGIVMKIVTGVLTAGVCYFIGYMAANK